MSPLSSLASDNNVYLRDLSLIWGGGWDTSVVYGSLKGSSYGVTMTTSSALSLIWGGGMLCGSSSLIWTNGMVTNDAGVWGGGGGKGGH